MWCVRLASGSNSDSKQAMKPHLGRGRFPPPKKKIMMIVGYLMSVHGVGVRNRSSWATCRNLAKGVATCFNVGSYTSDMCGTTRDWGCSWTVKKGSYYWAPLKKHTWSIFIGKCLLFGGGSSLLEGRTLSIHPSTHPIIQPHRSQWHGLDLLIRVNSKGARNARDREIVWTSHLKTKRLWPLEIGGFDDRVCRGANISDSDLASVAVGATCLGCCWVGSLDCSFLN